VCYSARKLSVGSAGATVQQFIDTFPNLHTQRGEGILTGDETAWQAKGETKKHAVR